MIMGGRRPPSSERAKGERSTHFPGGHRRTGRKNAKERELTSWGENKKTRADSKHGKKVHCEHG